MRRERIPPKRDVVTTETVAIGSLAVALHDAQRKFLDAEAQLEQLLDSLYGAAGWADFEVGDSFELDLYDVTPSDAAIATLHRAGFRTVTEHGHSRTKFVACACTRRHKEQS